MKKYILAFAAAGVLSLGALAATSSDAEARGRGGHAGFSKGGGHIGGARHFGGGRHFGNRHFGNRHFGKRHFGHRHWGHARWGYGVRYVGSSCWRTRWTPYGYRYVNICVRPLYY